MELIILRITLLFLLLFVTTALARVEDLLTEVIYLGLISFLLTLSYMAMNAADVAITENAVGSCISTIFVLWAGHLIGREGIHYSRSTVLALFTSIMLGSILLYITVDLPIYGSPTAAVNNEVYRYYLENTEPLFGFPNVVTAVLAGFRGYDTLIETIVVFTAALSVFILLGFSKGNDR
ncbi:DUF4040 domain-containing protein [Neorickettsia findlayensis]|uniref:DUF4040 domain-containing protein n=1 Tax=Neorickettsia findlayensis TaxID=2686014 RepID=A0A6P1G9A6_9RICK|nr:DUF4040 domain-containing protein [Neorickettsia findlayensis]QHD64890.1 DUF4040 domain-containing protein [Neorickettsia findlayensis]